MTHLEVRSPYDGRELAWLELNDAQQADSAMTVAQGLYEDRRRWLSKTERIRILEQTARLMEERAEMLAQCVTAEGGKPISDARVETQRAIEGVRQAAREIHGLAGREVPMGLNEASRNHIALTFLEPRGVAVAISAFNHPLNLVVHQVAPAVAAGCPVLIKPSLLTPLSCRHFVELLGEAGLPEGWCQMLICDNDVAERLVRDRRNAFLSFIGSAKVGWSLRALLPPGASCTLEHGGLAPMIVDETADWKKAMPSLVRGCFYHAGQVCVSGQRLFVHDSLYEDFVADFVESVRQIRAGDPNDPHVLVGPLISPREVERVETWVREAQEGGGRILCGGHRISERVFAPTVVENAPPNSTLVTREVFGPVVCIESYETLDRALQKANSVPEYFQASLFTRDLQRALSISRELNGMAVMVNECSAFRTDWMPFGGHRTSGLGVGGIGPMIKQLCVERMVVFGHEEGRE